MTELHLTPEQILAERQGRTRWSAGDTAHLAECAECRLEWELVQAAGRLGAPLADSIDPAQLAGSIRQRLATEPVAPRRLPGAVRWGLGLAAAAAVVLALVYSGGPRPGAVVATETAIAVLHELDELTPAELEAVLETLPPAADAALHVDAAPIEDLSAQDLERVLRSME